MFGSGLPGVRDVATSLDLKKKGEQKLSLRSEAINSRLEVVTQIMPSKKMSALFRRRLNGVAFSLWLRETPRCPTLHFGEAKEQPLEI